MCVCVLPRLHWVSPFDLQKIWKIKKSKYMFIFFSFNYYPAIYSSHGSIPKAFFLLKSTLSKEKSAFKLSFETCPLKWFVYELSLHSCHNTILKYLKVVNISNIHDFYLWLCFFLDIKTTTRVFNSDWKCFDVYYYK